MRHIRLNEFEHALMIYFDTVGADHVVVFDLNFEVVSERRLETDVIEGCDFFAGCNSPCIQNRPLRQLGHVDLTLLVAGITFDTQLTRALEV